MSGQSITFQRLGIEFQSYSKDRQEEAVNAINSLRMEQILLGESETYDWLNIMQKPELVECKEPNKVIKFKRDCYQNSSIFEYNTNLLDEDDQVWPYAEKSLYFFSSDSQFRLSVVRFIQDRNWNYFLIFLSLANIVVICTYDYQTRIWGDYIKKNRLQISFEIVCNIFFGFDLFLNIIAQGFITEPKTYMRNSWNFINFIAFFSTWSVLYPQELHGFARFLRVIRLSRVFRFIQHLPQLKEQMDAYVGSFIKLGSILVPLIFVMLYYCIIGLHLFSGLTEYRCRLMKEPENEEWEIDEKIKNLCGIWQCPKDTYCGSRADHHLPRNFHENDNFELSYNFLRFDDFFHSLFVVFTFLNVTGWSGTTFMFWKAMTTYVTAFYFVSLIFLLAYVLSNLLLGIFYESFMVQSAIKQSKDKAKQEEAQIENEIQKKKQHQMMERLAQINEKKKKQLANNDFQMSLYFSEEEKQQMNIIEKSQNFTKLSEWISNSYYFRTFNLLMIIISSFVIAYDHHNIPKQQLKNIQIIDFICTIYCFLELILNLLGKGFKEYLKKIITKLDFFVILSQIGLFCYLYITNDEFIFTKNQYINLIKSIKIIRLVRNYFGIILQIQLLYSAKIFYTISCLTRCVILALIKIKSIILLWLFLTLSVALIGRELMSNQARFEEEEESSGSEPEFILTHDLKHGIPPEINYDSLGAALVAAFNIFYNNEWHISMFELARATSLSIFHYVVFIIFGQVLFMRLLLAIFLNEFCKQLVLIEQQMKPIDLYKAIDHIKHKVKTLLKFNSFEKNRQVHERIQSTIKSKVIQRRVRKSIFKELKIGQKFNSQQSKGEDPVLKKDDASQTPVDQQQLDEDSDLISNEVEENNQPQQQPSGFPNILIIYFIKVNQIQQQPQSSQQQIPLEENNKSKTFFIFSQDSRFRQLIIALVEKSQFRFFNFILIILTTIRISILNPLMDPDSIQSQALNILYVIITIFYLIILLLHIIAFGFKNYFTKNIQNSLNFFLTILDLILISMENHHPILNIFGSLRILDFITLGAYYSKDIAYAQTALLNAFQKMIQLSIFCFFILIVYGVFSMKLLKGTFYHCTFIEKEVEDKVECMDYGGNWVNEGVNYDNVIESVQMLFLASTTEAWLPLLVSTWDAVGIDKEPKEHHNPWWALYFEFFFFIGNIIMLNMFIGLIVNTFQEAKMRAKNLHLLDENQKEWFEIKHSIYKMKPKVKVIYPLIVYSESRKSLLIKQVKNKKFKILWLIVIFVNTIILSVYFHRQNEVFKKFLDYSNLICVIIFTIEIISRFFAKDFKQYFKEISNFIDIIGIWFCIANFFLRNNENIDFYFRRCFNGFCVAFQLVRNFRIIKRFNTIEKLFDSIFTVIPSALSMMYIMFLFLIIATNLGMELFAYLRPQKTLNGWDMHFRTFSTAMFSLIRVGSSEQWFFISDIYNRWKVLIDSVHQIEPDFACNYIQNYHEFQLYGYNGCGTKWGYLFFICFELIFSLMIMNLFIASVIIAYEEHAKSEKSAISKYQLNDVIQLWAKYDPEGLGFINYKLFWRLSSEIAIIFGVEQADLLDVNNKKNFLKVLNIPIFEEGHNHILCYKFHDVILGLTKISVTLKYGVINLEPSEKEIQEKINEQFHKSSEKLKFISTPYFSGDMVAIIYIQKKFREWRQKHSSQKVAEICDLNELIKGKGLLERIQKQIEAEAQIEKNEKQ